MRASVGATSRAWSPALWTVLVVLGAGAGSRAEGPDGGASEAPRTAAELFTPAKVWTIHLKFTPEQWAAMEPAGGSANPFDGSGFGLGMFLTPLVVRDGDRDTSGTLSAEEFRTLGATWFAAWDADGDGRLDSEQIRAGLKRTMRPPGRDDDAGEPDGPPPGMNLQARKGLRNGLSGMMGLDFAYVHADLEFEGRTLADVGVRFKGNGTFLESRGSLKRSLKIDLNRYVKGQKLAGVGTLNLHNNVTDPGSMNEAVAFGLYRDFGVPAPRTSYATVTITVPGLHDRKPLGLYSILENIDKNFLADRGLDRGTAIFKPSSSELFTDQGDDWSAYEQAYDPKTELTEAQRRRVIEFCRLVSRGTDAEFAGRLGEFVDLDAAARFLAVSVWIGDLDSLLTTGQNFYLLLDPATNRFGFVPWDKDHTFGSWIAGTLADRQEHSIHEPWEGRKRLLERAFRVDAFRTRYLAELARFQTERGQPEQIRATVKTLADAIRPAVREESAARLSRFELVAAGKPLPGGLFGMGAPTSSLLPFVTARAASVRAQLDGQSQGFILGKGRPGDPDAPKPPEFKPEEMLEPALLKALDANKDKAITRDEFAAGFAAWFALWDADGDDSVPEDALRKGLNKALPFPFPFGGPPGGRPKPADPRAPAGAPDPAAAPEPAARP